MFNKFPITEKMHIHSLDGELREATILERLGDNDYLAEYNGVMCHVIYNPFVNHFYVGYAQQRVMLSYARNSRYSCISSNIAQHKKLPS